MPVLSVTQIREIVPIEGIAQMVLLISDHVCAANDAGKNGKYQNQAGLTLPMVD